METHRFRGVQTIFFDYMGTCLDWHSGIVEAFPGRLTEETRSNLALAWRQAFFDDLHARFKQGLLPEDIDSTHARLLNDLVQKPRWSETNIDDEEKKHAVQAWHQMTPWLDVEAGLARLKGWYEVFVLANGTTRLQLDLARSSRLKFDMLFSSQLLELTKPDPKIYEKALELVGCRADEAVMIAAHAYDLRAAQKVGMKTIYIQRWTEDQTESMIHVQEEFDAFVDGRDGSLDCGLMKVADLLEA